jgi:hypothetical protein
MLYPVTIMDLLIIDSGGFAYRSPTTFAAAIELSISLPPKLNIGVYLARNTTIKYLSILVI